MRATNILKLSIGFFLAVVTYATKKDIVQTASGYDELQTFKAALSAADLTDDLSHNSGPFTVFAPSNEAFEKLPDGLLTCLLQPKNKHILINILAYHLLNGKFFSYFLKNGWSYATLNGDKVTIDRQHGIQINDSLVVTKDIRARNGLINIIDTVLVPSHLNLDAFLATCQDIPEKDIPETATANGNFDTLVAALGAADLVDDLSEPAGPFTVFAPTDEAFASLPTGLVTCLLEPDNKDTLADILKYHVLAGKVLSTDLSDGLTATTLNGDDVVVDLSDGIRINDSHVITPDVKTTNGVIHAIDSVLIPSDINVDAFLATCRDIPGTAIANGNFETLVAALGAADLVDALSEPAGPFTVFAPTDKAFASLPDGLVTCLLEPDNKDTLADILKYHVLAGKVFLTVLSDGLTATTLNGDSVVVDTLAGIAINKSNVITPNVEASNGVIHVIDSVLVPSNIDVNVFLAGCRDIPENAVANGNFETLVAALGAADLVDALSEPAGPFTVFAPTDEAFASLPYGLVTCLLEPDNKDTLADILKYHVLAGKVLSTDLSDGLTATTLNGDDVVVDLSAGVKINDSNVSTTDVEASNGVIHIIDSVLVPSDIDVEAFLVTCRDIPETAIANRNFETLVAALGAADLVDALSEPAGPFTVFAPTDEAFASLPDGLVTCLLEPDNKDTLADILKYHVLAGKVLSTDLSDGLTATTLNGDDVVVDLTDGVKINDSNVSTTDVEASNGVIHVIDSVLIPSDIDVDAFLVSCRDIPETAIANGNFGTLVRALGLVNLVEALSAPAGPFTVFAPTDEAFASLPDGLLTCLVEPENEGILTDILAYHVFDGKLLSSDLSNEMAISTFNGDTLMVDLTDGVKINDSNVTTADVEANNGVIHIIDAVLIPSNIDVNSFLISCRDIPETAAANGSFETLVEALGAADLVDTLSEPAGPFTVFAPTDEAFNTLPLSLINCLLAPENKDTLADILKYHVVEGKVLSSDLIDGTTVTTLNGEVVAVDLSDGVKINDATVSIPDIEASNGVIHVIDAVLVPPDIDVGIFLSTCQGVIASSLESSTSILASAAPFNKFTTFSLLCATFVIYLIS